MYRLSEIEDTSASRKMLEIGPGHGFFGQIASDLSWVYRFSDISEPVKLEMIEKGFRPASDDEHDFDVVWMSHVLEHAPDHVAAREMLSNAVKRLSQNGRVVVVSPDYLSWKKHFFDVDATHGYPTTVRTVAQLMQDVGLTVTSTCLHRLGSKSLLSRCAAVVLNLAPTSLVDSVLSPPRQLLRDGPYASWKAVFGWRQLLVCGVKGPGV